MGHLHEATPIEECSRLGFRVWGAGPTSNKRAAKSGVLLFSRSHLAEFLMKPSRLLYTKEVSQGWGLRILGVLVDGCSTQAPREPKRCSQIVRCHKQVCTCLSQLPPKNSDAHAKYIGAYVMRGRALRGFRARGQRWDWHEP